MNKEEFETVTIKGTLPAFEGVTSKDIDAIVGNSDLMDELNKLVLNDTRDAYIRELLNQNRELRAEVKEANENAEWWHNRYNGVCIQFGFKDKDKDPIKALFVEHKLHKHRLETANEYIESRKENMLPEHYNDLKYILNECDLESKW